MNPESELSKAVAKFVGNDLSDVFFGCFVIIIIALVFGWLLGSCVTLEEYSLRQMKIKHGVAPITSAIEKEMK